ncbi:MAG: nuclear transport factor 2 family protein, partial [Bacteroidota bacterium]
ATETLGWKEIDDFVKTYIESHPEPDPIPELVNDIQVRLFGDAAWVSYEQNDAGRGRKRETRLMEKVGGEWKIAGMHTTIYGFETK